MLKKTALFLMCLMIFALILCACHAQPEENDEILATNPPETTEAAQVTEATTVLTEPETTQTTEATEPEPETTPKPTEPEKETTPNTFAPKPEKEEEPPKPTKPKQEESAKPTEPKQEETPEPDWKTAYLDFLETKNGKYVSFALVYIDGDSIPELYLNGCCEAVGDSICTCRFGEVIEEQLTRTGGGSYIPRSGLLINTNGNMGYYDTIIYKLTSRGFSVIWSGLEIADYVEQENGDYVEVSQFSIGGKTVSEEEYYAAIEAVFNTSKAVSLDRNAVSYDAIRKQIKNH